MRSAAAEGGESGMSLNSIPSDEVWSLILLMPLPGVWRSSTRWKETSDARSIVIQGRFSSPARELANGQPKRDPLCHPIVTQRAEPFLSDRSHSSDTDVNSHPSNGAAPPQFFNPASATNLAFHKVATASSTAPNSSPADAVDGLTLTNSNFLTNGCI